MPSSDYSELHFEDQLRRARQAGQSAVIDALAFGGNSMGKTTILLSQIQHEDLMRSYENSRAKSRVRAGPRRTGNARDPRSPREQQLQPRRRRNR